MNGLILFLLAYFLLASYPGWRIWQWLRLLLPVWIAFLYWPLYTLAALSPLLERLPFGGAVSRFTGHLRNYWLGIFALFLVFITLIDLIRLIRGLISRHTGKRAEGSAKRQAILAGWLTCLMILTIGFYGSWQARQMHTVHYAMTIEKPADQTELKLILASDLHMGLEMDARRLQSFVQAVNQLEPDLILLAGDLFDGRFTDLAEPQDAARILSRLQSDYGVYACLGNHDSGPGLPDMLAFLQQAGIQVLQDESLDVAGVRLAGRLDRAPIAEQGKRRPLAEWLTDVPPGQPVILLDHSPLGLAEARGQPVDLIVSGHTHNGQIFPGNLIVAQIYENAYGYKVYDALHSVVTSGVGTWGPPWRLASQSEIVLLTVSFKSS